MQQQVDGGADSLAPVIETARLILSGPAWRISTAAGHCGPIPT